MTRWLVTVDTPTGTEPVPCASRLDVWAVCWAARQDKRTYRVTRRGHTRLGAWWRARLAAFDAAFRTQFTPPGGMP